MSLSERINAIRKERKISIDELCARSGVPKGTLSKITAGITTNPTLDTVQAIARALNCRLDDFDDTLPKTNNTPSISNEALQVARDYSDLDNPGKRAVRVTLDDQTQRVREEAKKNAADFIYLPWNDQPASAGTGFDLDDEQMVEWKVIHNELTRKADFCLDVQGDSMEPKYYDGDTILVRKQPAVDIGEIGLFIIDGKGYVKKQGADRLISLNPLFVDIYPNEYSYVRCAGKVLGTLLPEWIISR